ncbi:MAG: hypothetical protein ACI85O_003854 [Saprospiraceae bacterium]|jgi:hypothetical protein
MITSIVTYLSQHLAKNKPLNDFFTDFSSSTVDWIKPLFLKEDGAVKKLKEKPDSQIKQDMVKLMLASEVEDKPVVKKHIEEIFSKINTLKGNTVTTTVSNSKNVVTGKINAGGNVIIGDNNQSKSGQK